MGETDGDGADVAARFGTNLYGAHVERRCGKCRARWVGLGLLEADCAPEFEYAFCGLVRCVALCSGAAFRGIIYRAWVFDRCVSRKISDLAACFVGWVCVLDLGRDCYRLLRPSDVGLVADSSFA